MIAIQQLIQLAPFPPDIKQQLLSQAESFSPEKKFETEEACWALISMDFQNRLSYEQQKAALEMAKGQKTYSKEDLAAIEQKLLQELTTQLIESDKTEAIDEVREKLSSHLQNPSTIPLEEPKN